DAQDSRRAVPSRGINMSRGVTMATIPASHADLLTKPAFAHLATVNADGSPQVTPVWIDFDGTNVIVNTARGRVKAKNIARQPRVHRDTESQRFSVALCLCGLISPCSPPPPCRLLGHAPSARQWICTSSPFTTFPT